MQLLTHRIFAFILIFSCCFTAQADVSLPDVFGDHMVLQREQTNPIWGTSDAGESVTVKIGNQTHSTVAGDNGKWRVKLDPLEVGGPYTLSVSGKNSVRFEDVLVGEVWLCSGQSNMRFKLKATNHAGVELAAANNSQIRLISVPKVGTQEPQDNFNGRWTLSTSQSAGEFSAVGYLFGKRLQDSLDVPIGLIDCSWGGSNAEAWVPRQTLESAGIYGELLAFWDKHCVAYTDEVHAAKMAEFKAWKAAGLPAPYQRRPRDSRVGPHRPANIYNGMVHPLTGYGIRGVIWYQGENNTDRSYQYRDLFPLIITTWRDLWQQGDFAFYWVQLADYQAELSEPAHSKWAELREAQTMALSLPHTGEAVVIDAGEGRDIHPRDKQTVANRLVRHALAKDYGFKIASDSPRYTSMSTKGNIVTLKFDHLEGRLCTFDVNKVKGFSIAGADRKFVWANAKIISSDTVEVSSELVSAPVAVRYAWANNPVANLYDRNGLPVTPFRTDDWPGVTVNRVK